MESSDEFAWTDASQDSVKMDENGDDSESGHSYKKKLQNELFNHPTNAKKKSKKRKRSDLESSEVEEPNSKHIKTEPESDLDIKPKKKKSKTSICESDLHDEEFLNLKVKEEKMSTEWKSPKWKSPKLKKKKKHRKNSDSADCSSFSESQSQVIDNSQHENDIDSNLEQTMENDYSNLKEELVDNENFKTKKKKSKKKKKEESINDTIIEDNFSAEETVVEQRVPNVHESLSRIEEKSKKIKRSSESMDKSEENGPNDAKQSFSRNLENNTETGQLNRSKNINETSSLFDNVASSDEILSANGCINLSQPLRKVADRIRFEDDSLNFSHDETVDKEVKHSGTLKKFLKRNAHLTPITVHKNCGSVITDEDEVWILKCPSEVDIKTLKDTSFVLENKCKLKAESQTYIGFMENYTDRVSILTLNQNIPIIKNIPLSGIIQFSKRIPKPHYIEDNNVINNQTNFIPLPDTKSRHPLFGVNYKSAIKIPKHISKRLNGLASEIIPEDSEKRKKKKKKHKRETNVSEDEQEMKAEPEPEPVIVHKKRKRKHCHDTSPTLPKRVKHDPDSAETWECEKAIEEQLFNF